MTDELTETDPEEQARRLMDYAETDTSKGVEMDMKRGFIVDAEDAAYRATQAHVLIDGLIDNHEILSDEGFNHVVETKEQLYELATWLDELHSALQQLEAER